MTAAKSLARMEWERIKAETAEVERKRLRDAERRAALYRKTRPDPDYQLNNIRRPSYR